MDLFLGCSLQRAPTCQVLATHHAVPGVLDGTERPALPLAAELIWVIRDGLRTFKPQVENLSCDGMLIKAPGL